MTEKPYGRKVAESLLSPTGTNNYWVIDDQGLWPKGEWNPALGTGNRIDFELESWRPAVMFATDSLHQAPGDLPALPFPFDAKDLTAFMLAGFGALVADHYGDWENGPNPERIDELNPLDFSRRAVKEAFESYREALKIVGPYPLELGAKAARAREAWNVANAEANQREGVSDSKPGTEDSKARLERAKASIVPQDLEMKATAAEAKAAEEKWLEAMVRELLKPAPVIAEGDIAFGGLGDKADSATKTKQNNGTQKRWTDARLQELANYRAKHNESETALFFGVSGSYVRDKLAHYRASQKTTTATPFSGLGSQ